MENKYKISASGISYHIDTDENVVKVLDMLYKSKTRVRIYNGDVKTGKAWVEENDTMGTIGRSTGINSIPLLLKNANSGGGPGLLEHRIVKIAVAASGKVLYQHPKFHLPTVEKVPGSDEGKAVGLPYGLKVDGEHYSNHKTERSRDRLYNYFTK